MLARIARGLTVLTPYVQKQRHTVNVNLQFVRLLSQTPTLNVAKQNEDDLDMIFDLGGSSKNSAAGKLKKSENVDTDKIKKSNHVKADFSSKSKANKPISKQKNNVINDKKEVVPRSKKDRSFEQLKYHDLGLNLTYVKLPFEHPGLQNLMLMLKSRKYRNQKNLLLVEGRRLTLEAIEAGLKLKYLFFSNLKQIEAIRDKIEPSFVKDTEIIRVPHNDLSYWSTLTTCPGLITVFEKPKDMDTIWENVTQNTLIKTKQIVDQTTERNEFDEIKVEPKEIHNPFEPIPITVICDQIREPNNLGSIIRTCASVPCSKIILLKGCADPWDIKALRGGCGAQFRIEIIGPVEWEELPQLLPKTDELSVFIADNQSQIDDTKLAFDETDQNRKQKTAKFIKPKVYSDIPFFNCKHIALIIGGETEGVSSSAFDFMKFVTNHTKATMATTDTPKNMENEIHIDESQPDNAVLEIPLGNGVESLNASVATAILLFEMRKQLTK